MPFWSTARQSQCFLPAIFTATSSRCSRSGVRHDVVRAGPEPSALRPPGLSATGVRVGDVAEPARISRPRLLLLDGHSLAYRAFFALPESIATHDGRPTNAIYGLA